MDNKKLISAIDVVIQGFTQLKEEISKPIASKSVSVETESSPAIDLLATRVAYAYTTRHPEYKINNQFNNLKDMISTNKISYIISWMRKGNTDGILGFLALNVDEQRQLLLKALENKETEIKNIFKTRFGHDN